MEQRLDWIKENMRQEFDRWCNERCILAYTVDDVLEFMLQKGFVKGKKWLDWIDTLPVLTPQRMFTMRRHALQDGFYPGDTLFGRKKK